MKRLIPVIAMLFVTFVLAVGINLAFVVLRPELFGGGDQTLASADSLSPGQVDTLRLVQNDSVAHGSDLTKPLHSSVDDVKSVTDSISRMRELLAFESARAEDLQGQLFGQERKADSLKTKKRKDFAKMIESMGAEDAARILQNLDDEELRFILMTVKKRQAGKILGAMDARRVAQVMN